MQIMALATRLMYAVPWRNWNRRRLSMSLEDTDLPQTYGVTEGPS